MITCNLKAKIFALGEWYSCRGLALLRNSGISTLGFKSDKKGINSTQKEGLLTKVSLLTESNKYEIAHDKAIQTC